MRLDVSKATLLGGKRRWAAILTAALLVILVVVAAGCAEITSVTLNSNQPAGPDQLINLSVTAKLDGGPARGVIAFRFPAAWSVDSVSVTGALSGGITESAVMEAYYEDEWETLTGAGMNGEKDGYVWWVGYTASKEWHTGDVTQVTVNANTHARGGTYYLDFVTGLADATDPNDPADKANWAIGSVGDSPVGVLLDQPITLYCFVDNVDTNYRYYAAIQGMGSKGLIAGRQEGATGYFKYWPDDPVTRAQYSKFIDNALGLVVDEAMVQPVVFSDLGVDNPADLFWHEYIWVAYNNNIIKGYTDGTFKPTQNISRTHVVTMTVRAMQFLHPGILTDPGEEWAGQTWGLELTGEARANARIAEYSGLLDNIPIESTSKNAKAPMPRREVAQIMWNMMGLLGMQ